MIEFEEEYEGVLRLKVPFERIDTSVFLIEADAPILVDCEPWNRNRIEGRAEVLACLAE